MPQVFSGLARHIPADALVISIVAGASIDSISEGLHHQNVVRAMPNIAAQIGAGITVWTESEAVGERQHQQAESVLQALGREVFLDDEDYLDMATALSGTGPSYVFLFMEALVDAGVHLGFSRRVAEELVHHTVKGSADFVLQSPKHLARLRDQVTSPGGTSAEALYYLEKASFRTALSRAVWAAYQRSIELGRGGKRNRLSNSKKSG
jgi:pyrroline-5-carboxylate reductase